MLVFRYLTRQIYATTAMVLGVLMLVFLSNQFVRYLAKAAQGKISGSVVFKILALQVPHILSLILPVSFFIGVLLAYGRLYVESEMTVLTACGMSRRQLVWMTLCASILVMLLAGFLSLFVNPSIRLYEERLKYSSQADTLIQTLVPGRFHVADGDKQVYYIESMSRDRGQVKNIFVARQENKPDEKNTWSVVSASNGHQAINTLTGDQFIVAENGHRYRGTPGEKDFQLVSFGKYGIRLEARPPDVKPHHDIMNNQSLWQVRAHDSHAQAELQWRLAMPISVPLLALLAIPLSRVNPRRGRFAQLVPAILLYSVYGNMIFVCKGWLQNNQVPGWVGIWWLHGALALLTLILFIEPSTWQRWLRRCLPLKTNERAAIA